MKMQLDGLDSFWSAAAVRSLRPVTVINRTPPALNPVRFVHPLVKTPFRRAQAAQRFPTFRPFGRGGNMGMQLRGLDGWGSFVHSINPVHVVQQAAHALNPVHVVQQTIVKPFQQAQAAHLLTLGNALSGGVMGGARIIAANTTPGTLINQGANAGIHATSNANTAAPYVAAAVIGYEVVAPLLSATPASGALTTGASGLETAPVVTDITSQGVTLAQAQAADAAAAAAAGGGGFISTTAAGVVATGETTAQHLLNNKVQSALTSAASPAPLLTTAPVVAPPASPLSISPTVILAMMGLAFTLLK
jgi:hypothetical protein